MKFLKYPAICSVALVLSCNSVHHVKVPKGQENSIEVSPKINLGEKAINQWSHLDLIDDAIPGISLEKAYQFLEGKKSIPIVVAVTDSGTDIQHEDLKDKLWINSGEIPDNKIDDDKNGFIDDVNGWNFLGDTYDETLEITRLYRQLKPVFQNVEVKNQQNNKDYIAFKALEDDYFKNLAESKNGQEQYTQYQNMLLDAEVTVQNALGKEDYTLEEVKNLKISVEHNEAKKNMLVKILESGSSIQEQVEKLEPAVAYYTSKVNTYYNMNFDGRVALNDDAYKMKTQFPQYNYHSTLAKKPSMRLYTKSEVYGDADVTDHAEDEIHGTHVSGIIMANRNNKLGAKGVAENARLMAVRIVPNGDEYDKDVALGIKYAVDNGAKVINTSFGKGYSPKVKWVYDAIKYAAKHDVLIVNAAGNDAQDIDLVDTFPKDEYLGVAIADNFLTVGATTRFYNQNLLASFTNYGKKGVDVFAPGHDIYNSIINNKYKQLSGTSMASPCTAGVAVLIRSYYPELSASQVKHIIMNSGVLVKHDVLLPGKEDMVKLSDISVSGRLLNAYNAVKMADKMVNKL